MALVDQTQAAKELGIPERTLEDWRYRHIGPAYIRVGRSIRYDTADIETYMESRKVTPGGA